MNNHLFVQSNEQQSAHQSAASFVGAKRSFARRIAGATRSVTRSSFGLVTGLLLSLVMLQAQPVLAQVEQDQSSGRMTRDIVLTGVDGREIVARTVEIEPSPRARSTSMLMGARNQTPQSRSANPETRAVTFDDNVTPDIIFGSGNVNGGFTIDRDNGVEIGLRGKLRFNASGAPENTFNSNGDGTYSFNAGVAPTQSTPTPEWSFEWSVNSDYDGSNGRDLDELTYELGLDADPGLGTDFLVFDNITPSVAAPFFDHAIGDNTTANGGGTTAVDATTYSNLLANNNVAQNSWRYDFFLNGPLASFDPTIDGRYTIYLAAMDGATELARTEIEILVGDAPVDLVIESVSENGDMPTPTDNDYTRINNAVQSVASGSRITLQGTFDWT